MQMTSKRSSIFVALAAACAVLPVGLQAQQTGEPIIVQASVPTSLAGLPAGPEIEGIITARNGSRMQVTSEAGSESVIFLSEATEIRGSGGFLGMNRTEVGMSSLINGLPVRVQTALWEGALVATSVRFSNRDMETAAMIRGGTNQRFAANEEAIEENAAATEALRGRVANIDQYNIRGTTNVYFDTGRWQLTSQGEAELCTAAREAEAMPNALLLVVGYTDSVGDPDYNQTLSERRASRVVNHLQQQCRWAPWRMMTPTGMAESDPLADNETEAGRAQNRRVSVNILISKALDEADGG